ncbi:MULTISPECIES: DMT family transporter [unclassified Agarivorans]|uniref:DMT family transporter n=1 Tax=unclassified Agarivorans TaxID=2636026 RepID=UPI003D7C6CC4
MQSYTTLFILIAAGISLVIQNIIMVRITDKVSTVTITLLLNSISGLFILLIILCIKNGMAGIYEAVRHISPMSLLPGVLGSFFVFSSIFGYKHVGVATTIAVLVGSQLIFGIIADSFYTSLPSKHNISTIVGALLLIAGVVLIVQSKK